MCLKGDSPIKKRSISDRKSGFWIHRTHPDLLEDISKNLVIGSRKKRSRKVNSIRSSDRIFIFAPIIVNGRRNLTFIAYTMVAGVYNDNEILYDYYESTRKIKLKGIKFFSTPLPAVDLRKNLSFLNGNGSSSALRSEYREISEADFKRIYSKANFVNNFPLYLENVSFNIDEFILNSINSLHGIIKRFDNRKQMDIKSFIRLLGEFMDSYGVSKPYDELEEFYSLNAWRTGIKHYPSRDPERIVTLYNSQGGKRDFGLISFE